MITFVIMYQHKSVKIFFKPQCTETKLKNTRVYQNQIANTFKFEVISESKYDQQKIRCLQNSFTGSL